MAAISIIAMPVSAMPNYDFINLSKQFNDDLFLTGINYSGQISATTSDGIPVLLHGNFLIPLNSNNGNAIALNDHGNVVGYSHIVNLGENHAVSWDGDRIVDLGSLSNRSSVANDINNKGQVVGNSYTDRPGYPQLHAAYWENGEIKDLGTLPGGFTSMAESINEHGSIVGSSMIRGGAYERAVLWNNNESKPIDLGTLNGVGSSYAFDINESNQIAGWSDPNLPGIGFHAVIWNGTVINDLGSFGGESQAFAINNNGDVVGYSSANPEVHAFIWNQNTGMLDLNNIWNQDTRGDGWVLVSATDINDQGWIIGVANNTKTNESADFLLHPHISQVPEPMTYAMLLAGLGMIGFMSQLRKTPNKVCKVAGIAC